MARVLIKSDLLRESNNDIPEKYVCPKCDGILRDAVKTSCGHWLCSCCAEEIFDKKDTTPHCPRTDCGEELTTEEGKLFFADLFVRNEINHFSIMCLNQKFGCEWSGTIGELFEHLSSCVYEKEELEEECPHCKNGFSLSEYQSHVNQCHRSNVVHVASVQPSSYPNEPGPRFIYSSLERHSENEPYCTPFTGVEKALGPSVCVNAFLILLPQQYYREEEGQGHARQDLTLTQLSPAASLNVTSCPRCNLRILSSEPENHKCIATCPFKDHGCKETKEMSREECIEHVSSREGIYSHMLMIASILSSLVPTGSTDALEIDRSYAESDGGYESMSKVRSASPKAMKRFVSTDGPDPSGNDLGFSEDGVVAGAIGGGGYGEIGEGRVDDKLMSLVMTKITGIQAELTKKESQIHTLQDKVAQLETTLY